MTFDRILAVQLKRLGDVVLAQPAFQAIGEAWPGARVTLLVESPFHEALIGATGSAEVRLHRPGVLASLISGGGLAARGYDLVVDLQGSPTSARLAWQTGAPTRVGWAHASRRLVYTHAVPRADPDPPRYTADQKLDLLRALGVEPANRRPRLMVSAEERSAMAALLAAAGVAESDPLLVVLPASRRAYKRWSPEAYAETVRLFLRAEPGARVVVTGGPGEEDVVEEVGRRAVSDRVLRRPVESIRELMALLERGGLIFGHDGGPKHLAQALDRPTFALFGPQEPAVWTPPDDPRHAVRRGRRPDCRQRCSRRQGPCECLEAVPAVEVAEAIVAHWRRFAGRRNVLPTAPGPA